MYHLKDFKPGDIVELWSHQGYDPFEERTVKSIDLETKTVVIAADKWNDFEDDEWDEFHFLASLKEYRNIDVTK